MGVLSANPETGICSKDFIPSKTTNLNDVSEYKTYILDEKEIDIWDDFVSRSPHGTIFHRLDWLRAAEKHSANRFIPVAVKKGGHIVCLLPLFMKKKYRVKVLLSPPDSCGIPHLGPVFNIPATNRFNHENTYLDITDSYIRFIEKKIGFDYFRIIHVPDIVDMRPYAWNGYKIRPSYTYRFNLTAGPGKIYQEFHSTTKNSLNKTGNNGTISVSREWKYATIILALVEKRYNEQNRVFNIGKRYFHDLVSSSLNENIEPVAVLYNGSIIAGDISLVDRKNAYAWLGTVNRPVDIRGGGELVLWENVKDYSQRGLKTYDFIGANTRHICKHKSKYGADLVMYFEIFKTSSLGSLALKVFKLYEKQ